MAARRMELERSLGQCPAPAQAVGQPRRIGVRRHARAHALRAFQNLFGAGKALAGQIGRGQAVGRRLGGVQLFRVGGVAQEFPQAGGLGAGGTEGVQHLRRRQPQQAPDRGGRRQRAGGAGGVEDLVVRAPQEFADPDTDFIAGHRRCQQFAAAAAERLRHRQRRREHHGGRMEHRAVVDVVLFGEMRSCRVDHRREQHRGMAARNQHFGGAVGRPHLAREPFDGFDRTRALAGQDRTEPVQHQVFGAADHRVGNVVELQFGGKGGEGLTGKSGHRRVLDR